MKNERAGPGEAYQPTEVEHIANVVTHGVWVLPSLGAMIFMVYLATTELHMTAAIIYGLALIALFSGSTAFHVVSYTGWLRDWRSFFHIGDKAIIYIFIASSYTPWLILKDFHSWAKEVLLVVWVMAVCGVLYQYVFHDRFKWFEIVLYLIIGVCPALVIFDMKESSGIYELSLGGLTYILGVFFFKSDGIIPFAHAIWHCFVFVGALFHYYAVCVHLLGASMPDSLLWDQL
ncbi:monocyte to macrophage differentiation factor 2-like isoform X2 [Littorina saxatilis]|uniref:monocyte to macrophage differentiation factor 2-like isoform X2 n=1 Tax=Littorina saxatilis TaxID=31220 RepID=UPI0038B54EA6